MRNVQKIKSGTRRNFWRELKTKVKIRKKYINGAIILKFRFINYTSENNNNKRSQVAKDRFHHKLRDVKSY